MSISALFYMALAAVAAMIFAIVCACIEVAFDMAREECADEERWQKFSYGDCPHVPRFKAPRHNEGIIP